MLYIIVKLTGFFIAGSAFWWRWSQLPMASSLSSADTATDTADTADTAMDTDMDMVATDTADTADMATDTADTADTVYSHGGGHGGGYGGGHGYHWNYQVQWYRGIRASSHLNKCHRVILWSWSRSKTSISGLRAGKWILVLKGTQQCFRRFRAFFCGCVVRTSRVCRLFACRNFSSVFICIAASLPFIWNANVLYTA